MQRKIVFATWLVPGAIGILAASGAWAQSVPMGSGPGMTPPVQRGQAQPTPVPQSGPPMTMPMGSGPGIAPPITKAQAPTPVPMTSNGMMTPMGSGPGMTPTVQRAAAPPAAPQSATKTRRSSNSGM